MLRVLVFTGVLGGIAVGSVVGYRLYDHELHHAISSVTELSVYSPRFSSEVRRADGVVMGYLEGELRSPVSLSHLPSFVVQAFLAIEDSRFYQHRGVSLISLFRAVGRNLAAGRFVEGGSTITQQTVRRFFLSPEKKISRKLREMIWALALEHHLSKDEILELYLGEMYLGRRAYGLAAAARVYFGHQNPALLSLAQSAYLAGLLKAPTRLGRHHNQALRRQELVLDRMKELSWISPSEHRQALLEEIPRPSQKPTYQRVYEAPYYIDGVKHELSRYFDRRTILSSLEITTSYQSFWQQRLETVLAAQYHFLSELIRRPPEGVSRSDVPYSGVSRWLSEVQYGGVIFDASLHTALALVGGKDYRHSQYNRALFTARPMGEMMVPIMGLLLMSRGKSLSDDVIPGRSSLRYRDILQGRQLWYLAGVSRMYGYRSLTNLLADLGQPTEREELSLYWGTHAITPVGMARLYARLLAWKAGDTMPSHSPPALVIGARNIGHYDDLIPGVSYQGGGWESGRRLIGEWGLGRRLIKDVFQGTDCVARMSSTSGRDDYWSVFIRGSIVAVTWVGSERGAVALPELDAARLAVYQGFGDAFFPDSCPGGEQLAQRPF